MHSSLQIPSLDVCWNPTPFTPNPLPRDEWSHSQGESPDCSPSPQQPELGTQHSVQCISSFKERPSHYNKYKPMGDEHRQHKGDSRMARGSQQSEQQWPNLEKSITTLPSSASRVPTQNLATTANIMMPTCKKRILLWKKDCYGRDKNQTVAAWKVGT